MSDKQSQKLTRLEADLMERDRALSDLRGRLGLLSHISQTVHQAERFEDIYATALNEVAVYTGWVPGPVILQNKDKDRLVHFEAAGHKIVGVSDGFWEKLAQRVIASGEFVAMPCDDVRAARPEQTPVAYGFPVLIAQQHVGAMLFDGNGTPPPDQQLVDLMCIVGTQLGRVLERQRAREALQRNEAYFRRLTDNSLDIITMMDCNGTIIYESPSVESVFGYAPEEYRGRNAFDFVHPEDVPHVGQAFKECLLKDGDTPTLTFRFRHKNGSWRILEGMGKNLLKDPIVAAILFNSRDVTERKRLEEQFFQSQKVLAIGQLAGGVAHDFNNILTAILGHSELILREVKPGDPLHEHAIEIQKSGNRAASLTRQLLAFSRRQVLQPQVLNLNVIIADMDKMLRRLLGEHISLVTLPDAELGRVKADPGQIEQVLLNLAVNARDAMPNGGKLTIETANVCLDERYARKRLEVPPGEYVMFAVSDTGAGMTPEIQARLFEPFFTTKEKGHGTGLGLATCHGIVKQSAGQIVAYSEPGRGSTFKVFFPRVDLPLTGTGRAEPVKEVPHGKEKLLFVEDEPMLRDLGVMVLQDLGYTVCAAENGIQALKLLDDHPEQMPDLLLTDVVMPKMGGRILAEQLRLKHPHLKVVFCSGYTEDAIIRAGDLDPGCYFIQKPYTISGLAGRIREALDRR